MATDSINTVARPYAKAAFDIAMEADALESWSKSLNYLAVVMEIPLVYEFIETPGNTVKVVEDFMLKAVGSELDDVIKRFLHILIENKRLLAIGAIATLFDELKAEALKKIDVEVLTFEPLKESQQQSLSASLKKRLGREVQLNVSVDKSILGGAVIRAGSLVIDGSVRSKLNALNVGLLEA